MGPSSKIDQHFIYSDTPVLSHLRAVIMKNYSKDQKDLD